MISGIIAFVLCQAALPFYDELTGRQVTLALAFLPSNRKEDNMSTILQVFSAGFRCWRNVRTNPAKSLRAE